MTGFLVTGAGGALGSVLMRELTRARRPVEGIASPDGPLPLHGVAWRADLRDPRTYSERVRTLAPEVIVHLGAVSRPADAYRDPARARKVNVESTGVLLGLAAAVGARFVYASTDLVFSGEEPPYDEEDPARPVSLYGRTKLEAESHVLAYPRGLVLRLPLLYGFPAAARAPTFFETVLERLRAGRSVKLFADEFRTPIWLEDAARACVRISATDLRGVMHLGGPERLSRLEMGERIAAAVGAPAHLLEAGSQAESGSHESRARDVSLNSSRYMAAFGESPGRPVREALQELLLHPQDRRME